MSSRQQPPETGIQPRTAPARAAGGTPDIDAFRAEHFGRLANEIEARVGIKLPLAKKDMVEGRLRRRVRDLGVASLEAYGRQLFEAGRLAQEFDTIVDCVTTNKTDFFRENEHFEILTNVILPQLLGSGRSPGPIKLWSAACSTGPEPYTLAMVLAAQQAKWSYDFSVLGTDINKKVLETAARGIYATDIADPIPATMRAAYTMQAVDARRREFRIVPELRSKVSFSRLNLMDKSFSLARDFHVIFCRNVLIYFDKPTQHAVIGRLIHHLRPDGFLFLGHSEAMAANEQYALRQVAPTVFQLQSRTPSS